MSAYLQIPSRAPGFDRLSDKAYEQLYQWIIEGKFASGERLAELKLAKMLKVGRTPLREALLRLTSVGLVESMPGMGFFVKTLTLSDLDELFQIRASLECLAVRLAIQRGFSDIRVLELRQTCDQLRVAIHKGDARAACNADLQFHRSLIALANSHRLETAIHSSHLQMLAWEYKGSPVMSHDDELVVEEHLAILDALEARDAERAMKLLNDHIIVAFQQGIKAAIDQNTVQTVLKASVPLGELT